MTAKPCKDCRTEGITTTRPTPHPGPRCTTHHRAERNRRRAAAHGRRIRDGYGLTPEDYQALYEAQGGHCAICQKARGIAKRLAVDHDHNCQVGHPPDRGCRMCIRALLCGPCNQLLGRYDTDALHRAIRVINHPPAQEVLMSQ